MGIGGLVLLAAAGACTKPRTPEPPPTNLGGSRIRITELSLATNAAAVLSATRDNNGQWQVNYLASRPPRDIQMVLPPEDGQRLDALLRDRRLFVPSPPPEPLCEGETFEMKIDAGGRTYDNPGNCRPEDDTPAYVAALLAEAIAGRQ